LGDVVNVQTNYAQCADRPIFQFERNESWSRQHQPMTWEEFPPYAVPYVALIFRPNRNGIEYEQRYRWQLPNKYVVNVAFTKSHQHRGQAGKIRAASNAILEQPPIERAGGSRRSKMYFHNPKKLRAIIKKRDAKDVDRYLYRGRNKHDHGIWEWTRTGTANTRADERVDPETERAKLPKRVVQWASEGLRMYSREKDELLLHSRPSHSLLAGEEDHGPLHDYLRARKRI
jgi:hypothetical protein